MIKELLKKAGIKFSCNKSEPSVEDQVLAILEDFRAPEPIAALAIANFIGNATGDIVTTEFFKQYPIDHVQILFVVLELARTEVITVGVEYITINPIAYDILNHFNIEVRLM